MSKTSLCIDDGDDDDVGEDDSNGNSLAGCYGDEDGMSRA